MVFHKVLYWDLYYFYFTLMTSNVSTILFPLLFADDINIFLSGKNPDNLIQVMNSELEKVVNWLNANKLSLNVQKTNFIFFKPKKKKLCFNEILKINRETIKMVESCKFLGIIID